MQAIRCRTAFPAPALNLVLITRTTPAVQRCLVSTQSSASEEELKAARAWLAKLHAESIPLKSIGELSFSRSSGPGGQNVNKYEQVVQVNGALC